MEKDKKQKGDFKADFARRVKENTTGRWIRFGIVSLIFFAWVVWLGNYWFLLAWLLLFDIYITGYIPFTWWKRSKSKAVRGIMSWVDAIVYALVLVYFIFSFLGQNYMIPSSSLEKTLLTGDYLLVDKVTYGPRVPITPLHIPLVHNKLPIVNTDSYLDWPQNQYRRLKGLRKVQTGDIVVFNFPAGDTVATNFEEQLNYYDLIKQYPREYIAANPQYFGEIKYRPVDRRTNYVKRAVGLPGQNFRIKLDTIYIDGKPQKYPQHVQFAHLLATTRPITADDQKKYGISNEDISYAGISEGDAAYLAEYLGFPASNALIYRLPMSTPVLEQMKADGLVARAVRYNDYFRMQPGAIFTDSLRREWTTADWGGADGVTIPAKGMKIDLTPENWILYERCIRNYEGNHDYSMGADGKVRGKDGAVVPDYTFKMDYYFMMGDNRDNSLDSRFWGFVPEDHIVGKPLIVLASFDKDHNLFNGGIRFNRIFRTPNPDKLTD